MLKKKGTTRIWKFRKFIEHWRLGNPFEPNLISKVVSTHVWNTPLNLYQRAIFSDSFHSWRTGDCLGCAISGCVVSFLDHQTSLLDSSSSFWVCKKMNPSAAQNFTTLVAGGSRNHVTYLHPSSHSETEQHPV